MSDPTANDVSAKLEALRQRFFDKAIDEFDALNQVVEQIRSKRATCDDLSQAYRILHRLAGSAGTFGFSSLGEEARRLELVIKPVVDGCPDSEPSSMPVDEDFCQRLSVLPSLLDMGDTKTGDQPLERPEPGDDKSDVLIIEPDQKRAEMLMEGLTLYGYPSRWQPAVEGWQKHVESKPAVVIIRDEALLANSVQLPDLLIGLPIICVGAADSFTRRYALAREGAAAFYCEPLNLPELADHIQRLLADHTDAATGRVLIVEDDTELMEHYRLVLTRGGMEARTVAGDPSLLLPVLAEFRPDIILMDVQMGDISGPALARMLRFEPEWLSVPIIYLSVEQDRELQLDALAKGGDDFLTKPVSDSFLLRAALIRCYRAKQLDKLVSRDSLTGLLKHSLVKAEIAREHARCQRLRHESCVAMLDLDHFKKVNDTQGHRAGDLVIKGLANLLRHRLRKTDIIGRYGGEEFIVALPDCSMEWAEHILKSVCEDFSRIVFEGNGGKFTVTLSGGLAALAEYPDSEEAIEAADQALYQRKRAGRNGVTAAAL